MEAHSTCAYDYLDIFNGPDTNAYRVGRYCGSDIPTGLIRSTGNTMTLSFVTDWSVQRAGFRLIYRTTYGRFTFKVPNTTIAEFANIVDADEMAHLDLQCSPSSLEMQMM